uniref:Lon N-terminal domain-containing protein n=2 Tax=Zea mays TaxID=4577 RepID=A0A804NDP1_MAIZE
MAERDRVLERERRQMEQILELDMEELQVEEVDDDGSSSSSDVDTFLRNTHGDGGINTYEELSIDTSTVSLQDHTYLGAKVDGARGKFAFLHGDRVLNLPMFYLQGVVLFPEASLHLRVFQPRLVEAIDKAINHVDAPCMIGVVYVYRHTNDGHYTIASVGTMAEILKIQQLYDGSSCIFSHGQQRFRLLRHWLDVDGVPWGEVQIIEEDTPQRTPRDAFAQLAAPNSFRDSLSPTSTSSDHSITDKRIYLLGSRSSGLVRCGIADESSNEGQNSVHEQSCQSHDSVKEIDGYGQPDKNTNTGDEDNLCFISSKSFQRTRKKDTKQQKHYFTTKNASQAPLSFWPHWAYEMYDSYSLSRRAAGKLYIFIL